MRDGLEDRGAEAAVETGAVHGGRDVEARADLALGAAVRRLGEVVQDGSALVGGEVEMRRVEVVREKGCGEGGHQGGGGAETGLFGFFEGCLHVDEAARLGGW